MRRFQIFIPSMIIHLPQAYQLPDRDNPHSLMKVGGRGRILFLDRGIPVMKVTIGICILLTLHQHHGEEDHDRHPHHTKVVIASR